MAASIKLLCILFFFCFISKGNCQCTVNDIAISQTTTGSEVNGKQEWKATITNNCVCSQYTVMFDCNGFDTVEKVDQSILMISGSECLVNNGQPIFDSNPISFTYAWDCPFPFKPLSSQVACS